MAERDERRRARIEAERARRRNAARSGRRRRRGAIVAGGVLTVAAIAGGAFARSQRDGDGADADDMVAIGRGGSVVVADAEPVVFERVLPAAKVTYRVETAGEELSVLTDVLSLRRPFEASLETKDGPPPGGESFSVRTGWFAHTATTGGGARSSVLEVAPAVPPTDLRLEVVLPLAVERDLVEMREVRRIGSRLCQVYRSRQTLAATVQPPTARDHVDTCVDSTGLVLEEVVTADGTALTRRVAVAVDEAPVLADEQFRVDGEPMPPASGGGFVRRVKAGSTPPGQFFVVDAPPPDFESVGRFSVVPPQPENFSDDITREGNRRASIVDVWVRGHDLVVVEQGGTLRGAEPFDPIEGAPAIKVGDFGDGQLLLSGAGVELRVGLQGGRYLRLYGTVDPAVLLSVAESMRQVPGGTLELEDAPVGDQP